MRNRSHYVTLVLRTGIGERSKHARSFAGYFLRKKHKEDAMRFRGVFFSLLLASGVCFMTLEAQTQTGAYGQSGSSGAAQGTSSQGAARTTTNSQKNSQSSSSQSSQTSQQSSTSSQSSAKLSSADQNFVKKAM